MVEPDIRNDVDDFFARELRHQPEHAMCAGMGRTEVDEHIVEVRVAVVVGARQAPVLRLELQCILRHDQFVRRQLEQPDFRRTRWMIFPKRIPLPP